MGHPRHPQLIRVIDCGISQECIVISEPRICVEKVVKGSGRVVWGQVVDFEG
jgi:hypothetical protein